MNSKASIHEIYIFEKDHFLGLNPEVITGYGISDLPNFFTWISAYRCQKCGQTMILSGELNLDHTESRAMGLEYWYYAEERIECCRCKQDIMIELAISYYALGWTCDEDSSGVEAIVVDGLEWLAEEYWKSEKAAKEKEKLEGLVSDFRNRIDELVELFEERRMYILIVEGKDDRAIWEQFLIRKKIPVEWVEILIYGEGGLEEAIKATKLFRGRKLKMIPHKLILDSDNDKSSIISRIQKEGIDNKNFYILEEKEIDSYLLDEEAIAHVLSVGIFDVRKINSKLKGKSGKERLEKLFSYFLHHAPDPQAKGLIARALGKIPDEIDLILNEIKHALQKQEARTGLYDTYV